MREKLLGEKTYQYEKDIFGRNKEIKIKGYISKTFDERTGHSNFVVRKAKGVEEDWDDSHWPPVEVEITVNWEKTHRSPVEVEVTVERIK